MNAMWLEDFITLAEARGFTRAAEQRFVTQPTFSRRIQALEDWLGLALIERSTHTFHLTPAGDVFLPLAINVLRQINHARQLTQEAGANSERKLRFAATHVLSLTFFPLWLRALEGGEPLSSTVELTADHMVACENLMLDGQAQFLICHHHDSATVSLDNSFRSIVIGKDALVPVARPDLLEGQNPLDIPRLNFTKDSGMGRILASAEREITSEESGNATFSSHLSSVLTAMARNGRGVAWSPLSQVADDLDSGMLCHVSQLGGRIEIEIRLWRQKCRQSDAAESFWGLAKGSMR